MYIFHRLLNEVSFSKDVFIKKLKQLNKNFVFPSKLIKRK